MTPKRPRDPNQLAKSIIDIATGQKPDRDPTPEEQGKSAIAVTSGSRGGRLRAATLTREQRIEIAKRKLLALARKLPPGQQRHDVVQEIGRFRMRIAALKGPDLRRPRRRPKAKGK